jgi:uncharacterized protein YwgA
MNQLSRLFASLCVLGISPTMTTFSERKRVQKLVYLLDKVFDMRFEFSYSWYLHGPYSPEVTKIVFDVIEGRQTVSADPKILSCEDLKKIDHLKTFLGDDLSLTDQLELLVSLHFLVDHTKRLGLKKEEAISFLKSKKPYFTDQEINEALSRLQELGVRGNCQ